MISFLRGTIVTYNEKRLVLEVNGVGFQIAISARDAQRMPGRGHEIMIHTYMSVREDDISLYGFLDEEDLNMYRMLINVSGIGPKGGLGILSAMSADTLRFSILAGDAKAIAKAPGIGQKTAQKLILECRDKIEIAPSASDSADASFAEASLNEDAMNDTVAALMALGYSGSDAVRAVRRIPDSEGRSSEELLKAALKFML